MDLFYACTSITIGNGKIAPFWDSPWLNGAKPRHYAAHLQGIHKKEMKVNQALLGNVWVAKI
jgi:hypothetical protein